MRLPGSRALAAIMAVVIAVFGCGITCRAQNTPPSSWVYSTYFGGSQGDTITAATRDAAGNVYVAGTTASPNFPTTAGVYEPVYPGPTGYNAVFVSKFSPEGLLAWSTFVGPGTYQFTVASGIQVDSDQNVYVAGIFQDPGFPTTPGLRHKGIVFVVKLNSTGSKLLYGATMGGNSITSNPQLAVDSKADAFVTGSGDLCCNGNTGVIGPLGGGDDFWIAEINSPGNALRWSVQIGGSDLDEAQGLAIDIADKLYVTGYTGSLDFPTTPGALDQPGIGRSFICKLDPSQSPSSSLVYSALVGNSGHTGNDFLEAQSIAVDGPGNAYVGAWTYNVHLFTSQWAFQTEAPTPPNAYVFELNGSGSAIVNGSYLGGGNDDYVGQVSVDRYSNVYVAGSTDSWDFPTTAYGQMGVGNGLFGAYYVKLNPQFAAVSSVVYGGSVGAYAALSDDAGGLWVGGFTGDQFATTANAYQPSYQGNYDGYLLHTDFAGLCPSDNWVRICTIAADNTLPERIHFTAQDTDSGGTLRIALRIDGMRAYSLHATQFDTWLPVAPGNHVATVLTGGFNSVEHKDQQEFSVATSSNCPLNPLNPSLTFCSPLNAAVIKGPVKIQVQANDPVPPKALHLYVDGIFQATIGGENGTYTYTLRLKPGVHHMMVQAKDKNTNGRFLSTTAVARVVN